MDVIEISLWIVCIGVIGTMAIMVQRIWRGPTAYDRLNALALIGTDTILLVVLLGLMTNQIDHYIDIAITYALTGFIGLALIAKYITDRQSDEEWSGEQKSSEEKKTEETAVGGTQADQQREAGL